MRKLAQLSSLASLAVPLVFLAALGCKEEATRTEGGAAPAADAGELFPGSKPTLPGPLAALSLGMDEAAAKKAVPALFEKEPRDYGALRTVNGTVGDKFASLSFQNGALTEVSLYVPRSALADAKKAWGEPAAVKLGASDTPGHVWLDEAGRVRAIAKDAISGDDLELKISSYLPYDVLASLGDDAAPLNPRAVLGRSADELIKELPGHVRMGDPNSKSAKRAKEMMKGMEEDLKKQGIEVGDGGGARPKVDAWMPPAAFSDSNSTLVSIHFNDAGTVRAMTTMLKASDIGKLGQDVKAAFDKAWGESKVLEKTLGKTHFWYDEANGIRASARLDGKFGVDVEFVRYMPHAKLFGEPGVAWGFEKAPILGESIEAIKAAYGESFVANERGGGHLAFPVTDYGDNVSDTRIQLRTKGEKVVGYAFDLGYRAYPAAKDEIEALLLAKFGEPKKGKRDAVYNKKSPKVSARDSDITDRIYIEVE